MNETVTLSVQENQYIPETRSSQQQPSKHQIQRSKVWSFVLLFVIGLIGLALTGAGVYVIIFKEPKSQGAETLVVAGVALIALATFWNDLGSLKFGKLELVLWRAADEAAARGDVQTAKVLQTAANSVGQRLATTTKSYTMLRSTLPAGHERTAKMGSILAEAKRDAKTIDVDAEEVLRLLWTGSEGARVWALGILQARPELATTRAVLEAVERPDQMFDQYQALVLADQFVQLPTTRTWARERIHKAVLTLLESEALGSDKPCYRMAQEVIRHAALRP